MFAKTTATNTATVHLQPPKDWSEITKADANSGCLVSRTLSELGGQNQSLRSILAFFLSACNSTEFMDKCESLGLRSGAFTENTELKRGILHPCYAKFREALEKLDGNPRLGLGFHGTPEGNIDPILCHGLDPKKRSGQSYGPGEYFATNPQISISYCRGGAEMFVFLVIIPGKNGKHNPPSNFMVVNNNSHQIPIGTMWFESVDHGVQVQVKQLSDKMQKLHQEAENKLLEMEEIRIKAAILQELMKNEFDEASGLYLEHESILSETSKREIAWFVRPILGGDSRFEAFFPNLPEPLSANELKDANITSWETSERHGDRIQRNLARTSCLFSKKKEQEEKKAKENNEVGPQPTMKKPTKRPASTAMDYLSKILQNIANNRTDVASDMFLEKGHLLDDFAKREIAMCVRRNIQGEDAELVPMLFPDLPDPDCPRLKKEHNNNSNDPDSRDDIVMSTRTKLCL